MALLAEIQNAAVDNSVPLPTLLRKCRILASRLGSEDFKNWIELELLGYKKNDALPPRRIITVNSKGNFMGPFQSGLKNADIPLICVPKEYREDLSHCYLRDPVSALESLVENSETGILEQPWNPNVIALVGQEILTGMNCIQAWRVIPHSSIVAALDMARTQILDFVLEIEAEAPGAGEARPDANPVSQERVTQIFNTHISGAVQNVATGGIEVSQHATQIGDSVELFDSILRAISGSSANKDQIDRISGIVSEMRNTSPESFKSHYQQFMTILSDHIQVFGPVVAPFLPRLTALLP